MQALKPMCFFFSVACQLSRILKYYPECDWLITRTLTILPFFEKVKK